MAGLAGLVSAAEGRRYHIVSSKKNHTLMQNYFYEKRIRYLDNGKIL